MYLLNLLPETLNTPEILAIITLLVAVGVHYQKGLTYREYREIHRVIERVFPVLDRLEPFGFRSFVHEKSGRESPEFVGVYKTTLKDVWGACRDAGAIPHLLKSVKRRELPDGTVQLSKLHLLWIHDDNKQTEVYAFRNRDGTIDLYAHLETDARDAEGHLSDGIEPGDVRGVLSGVDL